MSTSMSRLSTSSLDELYRELGPLHFGAGWNKPTPSLYAAPYKTFEPALWRYRDGHEALTTAGRLVDTELAERRNLIMINPAGNGYATCTTLVAAYQMLLPGEHARSHRHVPNALRLILDGDAGAYTTVDGVSVTMEPGDVVLTPSWMWHGHGNEGAVPSYWIDYLDVPLVHLLEPMFFELYPGGIQPAGARAESSPMRFRGADLQKQLAGAAPDETGRFARCVTLDAPSLPNIRLQMCGLDAGRSTKSLRTTANSIYSVVRGRGVSTVDGVDFAWERGDVFVVPCWRTHALKAADDAVLFRVSDEPLLHFLGFLREETI
ncbi:MAG TPA: cupin domain-containing protein [Candidatus Acidoferrales bacterium]|nr:cupin domain-containing protein [Candidatus Acidoferrales bacterium]